MRRLYPPFLIVAALAAPLAAAEFHVAVTGNDAHDGSKSSPLRTIQRAAALAQPGDVITVHAGTYRERINPPRGGTSDQQRIIYQAAERELVEIKGSEVIKNWKKVQGDVWKVNLPNSLFGTFNPYKDLIRGDWFNPRGRDHHTGAVYLNGDWLIEAAKLDEVLKPAADAPFWLDQGGQKYLLNIPLWFAQVDDATTTIWAQFPNVDPNAELVEINVRRTVFYPDQPGRNFITVRGFSMRHAATPWAPPTAEQVGLVGTHWSKGWIIENNVISHSACSGIALGKHGDQFDNTSANSAEGYVKTIERAHAHAIPWTRDHIGHHIVRNNTISHCEQAGLVGSLGCSFSNVTGNTIHDIHVRRLFTGVEMGGIKFHGAIDCVIRDNHVYNTCRGLWLDWMAQGTRVSRNLFHDNTTEDLFLEVNHGPFVVDNNLFLSEASVLDMSEGGAYVHNLFAGRITNRPEPRRHTPYHPPHSTTTAGLAKTTGGDNRFYNNIFVGDGEPKKAGRERNLKELRWISSYGLRGYDGREWPLQASGNVYYNAAAPGEREAGFTDLSQTNPQLKLVKQSGQFVLHFTAGVELRQASTVPVTTALLGESKVTGLPYVNADDSPLAIETDFLGKTRSRSRPTAGPFEKPGTGPLALKLR